MKKINQNGQSLVEALIALVVATVVISAMAVAAITAVNNADFSKYQNLATQYAQQGMDLLRHKSQVNWTSLNDDAKDGKLYCLAQGDVDLGGSQPDCSFPNIMDHGKNFFVRKVELIRSTYPCTGESVLATVTVSWTDGKCRTASDTPNYCHNVILNSCFANIDAE